MGKRLRGRKTAARRGMARGMAGGIGGAIIAGIGWKLGADLYDAIKRKLAASSQPSYDDDDDPSDPRNY